MVRKQTTLSFSSTHTRSRFSPACLRLYLHMILNCITSQPIFATSAEWPKVLQGKLLRQQECFWAQALTVTHNEWNESPEILWLSGKAHRLESEGAVAGCHYLARRIIVAGKSRNSCVKCSEGLITSMQYKIRLRMPVHAHIFSHSFYVAQKTLRKIDILLMNTGTYVHTFLTLTLKLLCNFIKIYLYNNTTIRKINSSYILCEVITPTLWPYAVH